MSRTPARVLVLCTGNSCRSIMAEALINQLGDGRFSAVSAGSRPTGQVHPGALATLARHGIDTGEPRSESWDTYGHEPFDYVITVCDAAAAETCPAFPGRFRRLHWSIPDPAHVQGTPTEVEAAFEQAFALLRMRIERELLAREG
jgi:arsenate reductase (thioredoxin)